jgi:NAD(P)-dependent dehydrogenase (short-subunit alcohol dehydrogenase family)
MTHAGVEHGFASGLLDGRMTVITGAAGTIGAATADIALGGDAGNVSVAGTSADGNLAAELALLVRDRGLPPPAGQALLYPCWTRGWILLPTLLMEPITASRPAR